MRNLKRTLLALALSAGASSSAFAALNLSGIGFVQYGDGQSYSLPIANLQVGAPNNPGSPYYVSSTPGAIKDLVVLGTGTENNPATTNFPGMDNAYSTPSGVSGSTFFTPNAGTSRGFQGTINNNGANTWDTSLLALKTFLNNEAMIFFFNNNQENSLGTAAQSLAAWAQITLKNAAGGVIGVFDFTNKHVIGPGGAYALVTEGGGGLFMGDVTTYTSPGIGNPAGGTNTSTDYVLSGGAICVLTGGPIPVPVTCGTPGATGPINHNLGANQAAYAILFPELNAQLTGLFAGLADSALANYTMSVDFRLGCDPALFGPDPSAVICTGGTWGKNLNNGYEQLFIATATTTTNVPEPPPVALLGIALLGVVAFVRRRRAS